MSFYISVFLHTFAAEISNRSFCCSFFVPVRKGSWESGSKKASRYVETLKVNPIPHNSRTVEAVLNWTTWLQHFSLPISGWSVPKTWEFEDKRKKVTEGELPLIALCYLHHRNDLPKKGQQVLGVPCGRTAQKKMGKHFNHIKYD